MDASRAASHSSEGCTLVELLLVMTMIGVLAAIAVPILLSRGRIKDFTYTAPGGLATGAC